MDRKKHRKLLKLWEFTSFVQFVVDDNEDFDGKYVRLLTFLKERNDFALDWMEKLEKVFRIKYQSLLKKRKKIPKEIERLFLQNEILDVTGDDEVCIINLEDSNCVDRVEISDDEETEANLAVSVSAESRDTPKDDANTKSPEPVADNPSPVKIMDESRLTQTDHVSCKSPEAAKGGQTVTPPRPKATVRPVEEPQKDSLEGSKNGHQLNVDLPEPSDDDQPSTSAQARARLAAAKSLEQIHKEAASCNAAEAVKAMPADKNRTSENGENGQSDPNDDCILWEDAAEFMCDEAEPISSDEPLFSRRERTPAATQEWETELLAQLQSKKGDELADYLKSLVERLKPAQPLITASPKTPPVPRIPIRYNGSISIGSQPQSGQQPVLPPAVPTIQMRAYQRKDPRILRKLADLQSCLQDPTTQACVASLMTLCGGSRAPPRPPAPALAARPVQQAGTVAGFTPAPQTYREHKMAKQLEDQRKEEAKKREEERRKQMERAREEARRQEEEHQRQQLAKRREEERRKQVEMAKEARRHQDGEGEESAMDDNEPHKENARDNRVKDPRTPEGAMDSQEKTDRQLMRVLRGLETNMNTDYTPSRLDGKRRSSLSARSAIKAQLTARWPAADKQTEKSPPTNRRKSLDVRTFLTSSPLKARESRKSVDARLGDREATPCRSEGASSPKKRRHSKSANSRGDSTKRRCNSEPHSESPKRSCGDDALRAASFQNCWVRLKRVQIPASASRGSSRASTPADTTPLTAAATISGAPVTPSSKNPASATGPTSARTPSTACTAATKDKDTGKETIRCKPPAKQRKATEPRRNTNRNSTERNTKVCVLCRARPRYMTHHFVWKHQTESYVSRLTDSELDALTMTSRFVKLIAVDAYNPQRHTYTTDCRFCGEQLESTFYELHHHFSRHTGEFSYQCVDCEHPMAYRKEMPAHRERSKCRGGLKRMYSYPEKLQVIYLYYCVVCNFVQLHEANVYRHLRLQHDKAVDDATLVKRLVLAAINDPNEPERSDETEEEASGDAVPNLFDGPSEEAEPINVVNEPVVDDFDATMTICKEEVDDTLDFFEAYENVCPNSESIGVTVKQEVMAAESCDVLDGTLALPPMISIPSLQIGSSYNKDDVKPEPAESVSRQNKDASGASSQNGGEGSQDGGEGSQNGGEGSQNGGEGSQVAGEQPEGITKPRTDFRAYSAGDSCYGLFKCMAADCIHSSDEADQFLAHVEEHAQSSNPPEHMLECSYCLLAGAAWSPALLVEHIQTVHANSRYQCSVCSYRSCSFSNVYTHWQSQGPEHKDNPPLIYECGDPVENSNAAEMALSRAKECAASNVRPLKCTNCDRKFYGLNRLEAHGKVCPSGKESLNMTQFHERKFSCVYCELDVMSIEELRCHLADQHYDEHPYGCERVTLQRDGVEAADEALNLHFLNLSKDFAKDYIAAAPRPAATPVDESDENCGGVTTVKAEPAECDEKPNAQQLVALNVLMVKPLLMKLTESTGIGPDKLYQCPYADCGGFFSRFQFWSRHMLATHSSIMPACPHCPGEESVELSLQEYEQHFELHRRRLHVCYYCAEACATDTELHTHLRTAHGRNTDAPEVKQIDVTCYLTYSYHVLLYLEDFESDLQVLQELQSVLRRRIEANAAEERGKFVSQWSVPASAKWLETLPVFVPADLQLECNLCRFKSTNLDEILQHEVANHPVVPTLPGCLVSACKARRPYRTWNEIIDHLRAHRHYLYVCCHCSFYHHSNNGLIGHIRTEHDSCDVPVITLNRSSTGISVAIAVVMAVGKRTLSPKRCFCCDQHVTALVPHLKSAHGLVMQYVCELCNAVLSALTESELHQQQHHPGEAYKLRCNFKLLGHLAVSECQPLAIEILTRNDNNSKNKSTAADDDDDVTMLDDDDIIIEEELKKMAATTTTTKAIALKCIPIGNLKESTAPAGNQMDTSDPGLPLVLPNMPRQQSHVPRVSVTIQVRPPPTQQNAVLSNQPPPMNQNGGPPVITTNNVAPRRLPTRPPVPRQIPVLSNQPPRVSTHHPMHSAQQQSQLRQICMSAIERQIRQPQQSNQDIGAFQHRMDQSGFGGSVMRAPTTTQFSPGQNTNAMVPQQPYPNGPPQSNVRNPERFLRPIELQHIESRQYPTFGQVARQFNAQNVTAATHQNLHNVPIQHQQQHTTCRTQNPQTIQPTPNSSNSRGAPSTNHLPNSSHVRGVPSANQPPNSAHNHGPPSANQLQQLPTNSHNRGPPPANQLHQPHNRTAPSANQPPNSAHNRGPPSANQPPNSSNNHGAASTNQLQQLPNNSHNARAPSTNQLPNSSHVRGAPSANQPPNSVHNRGPPSANQLQQLPTNSHNRGTPPANQLQQPHNRTAPSANQPPNSAHNRGPPSANQLQQLPTNSHSRGVPSANQPPNSAHNRGSPPANHLQQLPTNSHSRGPPPANQLQQPHNRGPPSANHLQHLLNIAYKRGPSSTNQQPPSYPQNPPASNQHMPQLPPVHDRQQINAPANFQ